MGVQSANICIAISDKHGGPECKHLYSYFKQTWGVQSANICVAISEKHGGVQSANICIAISNKHGGVQSSNICITISNKHGGGPECKHLYSYFKQTWAGSRVQTFE